MDIRHIAVQLVNMGDSFPTQDKVYYPPHAGYLVIWWIYYPAAPAKQFNRLFNLDDEHLAEGLRARLLLGALPDDFKSDYHDKAIKQRYIERAVL